MILKENGEQRVQNKSQPSGLKTGADELGCMGGSGLWGYRRRGSQAGSRIW